MFFSELSDNCLLYTSFFASKARKEGYEQIAALFEETAQNEKEHAKMWFKYLEGGAIKDLSLIHISNRSVPYSPW